MTVRHVDIFMYTVCLYLLHCWKLWHLDKKNLCLTIIQYSAKTLRLGVAADKTFEG